MKDKYELFCIITLKRAIKRQNLKEVVGGAEEKEKSR